MRNLTFFVLIASLVTFGGCASHLKNPGGVTTAQMRAVDEAVRLRIEADNLDRLRQGEPELTPQERELEHKARMAEYFAQAAEERAQRAHRPSPHLQPREFRSTPVRSAGY